MKTKKRYTLMLMILFWMLSASLAPMCSAVQLQPDINKNAIKSDQIKDKQVKSPRPAPALRPSKMPGVVPKSVEISWFKVSKTRFATALSASASSSQSSSSSNTSVTVMPGDTVYFSWKIKGSGIDPSSLQVKIGGQDLRSLLHVRTKPGNTFEITGTYSLIANAYTVGDLTLSVIGGPTRPLRKIVHVSLHESKFEFVLPLVDQDHLKITLKGKNSGRADFEPDELVNVHCMVTPGNQPSPVLIEQTFELRNFKIEPGQQKILGQITLPDPALAFGTNAIKIYVTLYQAQSH